MKNTITETELRNLSVIADRVGDDRAFALIAAAGRGSSKARQLVADAYARAKAAKRGLVK